MAPADGCETACSLSRFLFLLQWLLPRPNGPLIGTATMTWLVQVSAVVTGKCNWPMLCFIARKLGSNFGSLPLSMAWSTLICETPLRVQELPTVLLRHTVTRRWQMPLIVLSSSQLGSPS